MEDDETGWVEAFVLQREPLELDPDNGVGELIAAESARIRRELLEAISAKRTEWALAKPLGEDGIKTDRDIGADAAFTSVLITLDRICPERKEA